MGKINSLEEYDTGIIQSKGYKLRKVFSAHKTESALKINKKAMEYAEQLAKNNEVGVRPLICGEYIYIDVYTKY